MRLRGGVYDFLPRWHDCAEKKEAFLAIGARRDQVGQLLHLERVRAAEAVLKGEARALRAAAVNVREAVT